MAKMIKDTQKQVHPVTKEEGSWARAIKTWVDPSKPGDKIFKGMIWYVAGGKIIRDKAGNDVTALYS
jgi:hypothetical protein